MLRFSWLLVPDIPDRQIQKWWDQIPSEKQSRLRMLPEQVLRERICSDALARQTISDFSGIPSNEIIFSKTGNGKPYCEQTALHFNISHSYGLVCCGISEVPIGVDVEHIRRISPALKNMLSAEEQTYIRSLPDKNGGDQAFLSLWTMREAIVKCDGGTAFQARKIGLKIRDGVPFYPDPNYRCGFPELPGGFIGTYCEKIQDK